MKLFEILINNKDGWGAVPNNQEIDYRGIRVAMQPTMFFKLAAALDSDHKPEIEKHISSGGAIGAPFLEIDVPDEWLKGDFSKPARTIGHEGRNRMTSILKLEGDNPIEVHIFPVGLRSRHLTPEIIQHINNFVCAEKSTRIVQGPYFTY